MKSKIMVAGLQKQSFIDYPGKIASVIFMAGCNMRCHYCHNPQLFNKEENIIPFEEVLSYLNLNKKMLDGVVITGGEPTLDENLNKIITQIKEQGLAVKLDTNGTNPEVVKNLIESELIDYVALDIKSTITKYKNITGLEVNLIQDTANYLKSQSKIDYMFRTTLSPRLTVEDIKEMGEELVKGAKVWQLQQCRIDNALSGEKVLEMAEIAKTYAQNVVVKGL